MSLGTAEPRRCLLKPELCFLDFPWLQDARQKFRSVLVEATVKLDELVKKIGKAVEDSKPYWEARKVARQVREPRRPPPLSLPATPSPRRSFGCTPDFRVSPEG